MIRESRRITAWWPMPSPASSIPGTMLSHPSGPPHGATSCRRSKRNRPGIRTNCGAPLLVACAHRETIQLLTPEAITGEARCGRRRLAAAWCPSSRAFQCSRSSFMHSILSNGRLVQLKCANRVGGQGWRFRPYLAQP